tara:strand:+ start:1738 stop:2280 length:543 start_codon:yes stop_codon:yes gene_type:complete
MPIKTSTRPVYTTVSKRNIFTETKDRIQGKQNGATVIVPHVCNNIGLFNGGFAAAVAKEYPLVKENYSMLGQKMKLGYTQFVTVAKDSEYNYEIIFANMIAQNKIKTIKNTRPLNYAALTYCMSYVKMYAKQYRKDNENLNVEIHCPKFGSGLAGGDWRFVSELIQDSWSDIKNIFVYTL